MSKEIITINDKEVSWHYKDIVYPNQEVLKKAIKYAEYSWWDILIAFREVGVVPTEKQELDIKTKLAHKKYAYLTR